MSELLSRMNGGELIALFSIAGGLLVGTIAIVTSLWASVRRAESRARQVEMEAALKQDMLNRGMSAGEIERVISASQTKAAESNPPQQVRARRTAEYKD